MDNSKHILFLSYDGMTDPLGQSQVIPYLKGLCEYGYRFTIVSFDKPELYKLNKQAVEGMLEESEINWVSLPYHKSPPVISSIYDYYQMKRAAFHLHKQFKFDMVHTRPGIPTLVALKLKTKTRIKFLNDVRGFWAQERIDGGMWNLNNPVYKKLFSFFRNKEMQCIARAEDFVCLTEKAKDILIEEARTVGRTINPEVIPCSADVQLFDPSSIPQSAIQTTKQRLGIDENKIIISYLGSIGGWYLTEEMMRFCKIVQLQHSNVVFLFIAPHRHEKIREAAAIVGLSPDSVVIVKANRNEVPTYLSLSNYNLFFIKPAYSKLASSPTKHGEVMAMGIPVITNTGVGDVDSIIKKYNAGWLISDFTESAYAATAKKISETNFNKEAIRAGALEIYSLENAIQSYRKVYKRILG